MPLPTLPVRSWGGMITGGQQSASAVKENPGPRTQVANVVAWAVTMITLLFLTPLFTALPEPCWRR